MPAAQNTHGQRNALERHTPQNASATPSAAKISPAEDNFSNSEF